jgi:serine/threonine-protein kinase
MEAGGRTDPLLSTPGVYLFPKISPFGDQLLLSVVEKGDPHISIYDLARDKLTAIGDGISSLGAVWTRDGRNVIFGTSKGLLWGRADGGNKPLPLTNSELTQHAWSLPQSGTPLALIEQVPRAGFQIRTLPLSMEGSELKAGKMELFPTGRAGGPIPTTYFPTFSPDGRWIAYDSNESGRFEVYVQPYPASANGPTFKISDGGDSLPLWSPNGRQLFYKNLDQKIRIVNYSINGDSFVAENSRLWSEKPLADTGTFPNYDLAPDGKRIAALMPIGEPSGRNRVTFVMNFTSEIARRLAK